MFSTVHEFLVFRSQTNKNNQANTSPKVGIGGKIKKKKEAIASTSL